MFDEATLKAVYECECTAAAVVPAAAAVLVRYKLLLELLLRMQTVCYVEN
jgi:hypothetical protein